MYFQGNVAEAFLINAALSVVANRLKALSIPGALVMGLMGFWIYLALGWRCYLVPITFFALGSLFTRLGYAQKKIRRVAEKTGGLRGAREVLANGLVPLVLTLPIMLANAELFMLGYVAAWATALCDTSSTELGGLWGKRTFLVKNLQAVAPGTAGAISLEGTAAGFAAALLLVLAALALGLVTLAAVLPLGLAALAGGLAESLLHEVIRPRHRLRHEALNFANTFIGGGLALAWGWLTAAA